MADTLAVRTQIRENDHEFQENKRVCHYQKWTTDKTAVDGNGCSISGSCNSCQSYSLATGAMKHSPLGPVRQWRDLRTYEMRTKMPE